jgi:hypothetical protein
VKFFCGNSVGFHCFLKIRFCLPFATIHRDMYLFRMLRPSRKRQRLKEWTIESGCPSDFLPQSFRLNLYKWFSTHQSLVIWIYRNWKWRASTLIHFLWHLNKTYILRPEVINIKPFKKVVELKPLKAERQFISTSHAQHAQLWVPPPAGCKSVSSCSSLIFHAIYYTIIT